MSDIGNNPMLFCTKHLNHVFPANLNDISMQFCNKHLNHIFLANSKEIKASVTYNISNLNKSEEAC
jgi:hypothetical protein